MNPRASTVFPAFSNRAPPLPLRQQGHLEFFICNADDLPGGPDSPVTQSCFNKYPLDRAADDGDASPIDPNHPGRYYVDPPCRAAETDQTKPAGTGSGDVVTARYQLPAGLTCERCTIQMVYCELFFVAKALGCVGNCALQLYCTRRTLGAFLSSQVTIVVAGGRRQLCRIHLW